MRIVVPAIFAFAFLVTACNRPSIDACALAGTWHLVETDSGSGKIPARGYNIHRFFADSTLQILDAEKRQFVIEGNTIHIISQTGSKQPFENIISFSDHELILSDIGTPETKMIFVNITDYSMAITGEWRLKNVIRNDEIIGPSEINMSTDLLKIFEDDGMFWEIKDGIKSGPFPFTVNGIFVEIQLGQGKTDYFEIHLLNDTTLERNLVPGKTSLRTVYEKIPPATGSPLPGP